MDKYDVVKDWEGINLHPIQGAVHILSALGYFNASIEMEELLDDITLLRDKQLKTFPKLERK